MPVTPEDLLQAAVTLGGGNGEVDWRNAVSRGYYAAYHRCLAVAQDARLPVSQATGVHSGLVRALTDGLKPGPIMSLGYMLEQCRKRRVVADYELDAEFSRSVCQTVLGDCRRIFDKAARMALADHS